MMKQGFTAENKLLAVYLLSPLTILVHAAISMVCTGALHELFCPGAS